MREGSAYDALIVGGSVNGLAAAAYLAMAGKRVLVLEARNAFGGLSNGLGLEDGTRFPAAAHTLYALDPGIVAELKLARHGLKYAVRDMPLAGLRADGKHLVLTRDAYASARHIAVHSEADAKSWARFRREWFRHARELRALWWQPNDMKPAFDDETLQRFVRLSTAAWLDSRFESDAVKALLGFDAHAVSPLAAGSSLLLLWRAAQEMCGLQGAAAFPKGGFHAVADAFAAAARDAGVELRTGAKVADILFDRDGAATGVKLESDETLVGGFVISCLPRKRTLGFPSVRAALQIGEISEVGRQRSGSQTARVTLVLDAAPLAAGSALPPTARWIICERLDSLVAAHVAAGAGRLPAELTMEAVLVSAADPQSAPSGRHILSVLAGPVPARIDGGWHDIRSEFAARVVAALMRYFPGLDRHLVSVHMLTPQEAQDTYGADGAYGGAVDVARLMSDWRMRVRTPIPRLLLCGAAADPVGAVSGRGGRMAACLVFEMEAKP